MTLLQINKLKIYTIPSIATFTMLVSNQILLASPTGAFGLSYGSPFGYSSFHSSHLKAISHLRKELAPVLVEKYVPVPVHIPKLVPVTIEKAVPVPVKVNVPQPYPVYKRIAVPVKVPVDRPVPVHVFKPYPVVVEKQVPYPVDKPVPVPVKVPVDRPYPVYIPVEKSTTEKPVMTQIKWIPEKALSLATDKPLSWLEKPELSTGLSFKLASTAEAVNNEKLLASWLDTPEPSELDIDLPDNIELEIRK